MFLPRSLTEWNRKRPISSWGTQAIDYSWADLDTIPHKLHPQGIRMLTESGSSSAWCLVGLVVASWLRTSRLGFDSQSQKSGDMNSPDSISSTTCSFPEEYYVKDLHSVSDTGMMKKQIENKFVCSMPDTERLSFSVDSTRPLSKRGWLLKKH